MLEYTFFQRRQIALLYLNPLSQPNTLCSSYDQ